MALLSINYYNTATISKDNIKSELQSHLKIITATILQCKELSGSMPIQNDGNTLANDTLLNSLDCNTTTRYKLDGGRGAFIPNSPNGFSNYKATQTNNEFYFSTTASLDTIYDDVLIDLNSTYSTRQYELISDGLNRELRFYLYRN